MARLALLEEALLADDGGVWPTLAEFLTERHTAASMVAAVLASAIKKGEKTPPRVARATSTPPRCLSTGSAPTAFCRAWEITFNASRAASSSSVVMSGRRSLASAGSLEVKISTIVEQLAASVTGGKDGGSMARKGTWSVCCRSPP